eukprot:TRINITY_DN18064_c0_g1_i1.p1 TRINITY_DN18064_c0_g1~~TRINITY_DN18064_c0_g1_i1.p1  ORF type:complete len:655 (+),score=126.28 TRINITY_DN18064_c0_g1_i1:131-2095(+)
MAQFLRSMVSRDRVRYKEGGFNLDLSYITDNILAMSFPAQGLTSVWRNHIEEVERFLQTNHPNNFKIWNLTETPYDYKGFTNKVLDYPFPDHHAPSLTMLFAIVNSIDMWLGCPEHVAVIHCKGGKGRTGLVVVCYLLFACIFSDITMAAKHFAEKRSSTSKGVTQPSQIRYLEYFSSIVAGDLKITPHPMRLQSIRFGPIPKETQMYFEVYDHTANRMLFSSLTEKPYTIFPNDEDFIDCSVKVDVVDDVLIRFFTTTNQKESFHVIINTFFVPNSTHVEIFGKQNLDNGRKSGMPDEITAYVYFRPPKGQVQLHAQIDYPLFYSMRERFKSNHALAAKMSAEREAAAKLAAETAPVAPSPVPTISVPGAGALSPAPSTPIPAQTTGGQQDEPTGAVTQTEPVSAKPKIPPTPVKELPPVPPVQAKHSPPLGATAQPPTAMGPSPLQDPPATSTPPAVVAETPPSPQTPQPAPAAEPQLHPHFQVPQQSRLCPPASRAPPPPTVGWRAPNSTPTGDSAGGGGSAGRNAPPMPMPPPTAAAVPTTPPAPQPPPQPQVEVQQPSPTLPPMAALPPAALSTATAQETMQLKLGATSPSPTGSPRSERRSEGGDDLLGGARREWRRSALLQPDKAVSPAPATLGSVAAGSTTPEQAV